MGFAFTEEPVTNIFFNLRPGHEELAEEMVEYAEENMQTSIMNRNWFFLVEKMHLLMQSEKKDMR